MKTANEASIRNHKRAKTDPGQDVPHQTAQAKTRAARAKRVGQRSVQQELERQVGEAATEIVRAQIDKAKAGSLAHTRWIYGLLDNQHRSERLQDERSQQSLTAILMDELAKRRDT